MDQSTKDSKSKNTKTSSIDAVNAASELGMNYISHTDGTRLNHIITELEQTHDQENKLKRQLISCLVEIMYKNVMPYLYKNTEELKSKDQIILSILNYINKQLNTKEKITFIHNKYPNLINALIDILLNCESKVSSEYMIAIVLQREAFLSLKKKLSNENIPGNGINILNEIVKLNQNPEYPHSAYIEDFFKDAIFKLKINENLHKESSKTKMAPPQSITLQKNTSKNQSQVNSFSVDDNENNEHHTKIKENIDELQSNITLQNEANQPIEIIFIQAKIMENLNNIYGVSSRINNIYHQQFCTLKNSLEVIQKNEYFYPTIEKCIEEYKKTDNINIFLESFLYYIELIYNLTELEQYIKKSTTEFASEIDKITSYLLQLNSKYPNASSLHISINKQIQTITNATNHNMHVYNQQSTDSSEITPAKIKQSITKLQEIIDSFLQSNHIEKKDCEVIVQFIKDMQNVVNKSTMDDDIKKIYICILRDMFNSVKDYNINDEMHSPPALNEKDELIRSSGININDLLAQADILVNQLHQTIDQNEKGRISADLEKVQTQINLLLNDEQPTHLSSSTNTSLKRRNIQKIGGIEVIYDDSDNVSISSSPPILTQFSLTRKTISNDTTIVEPQKKKRMLGKKQNT